MDCLRNGFAEGTLLDGRFETVSPLNHGSFGMVFLAKDTVRDELVAIKCLTKPAAGKSCPTAFAVDDRSEELAIHARIGQHPNIVNLLDSFETDNHIYLVLEFCANGDLYEAIRLGRGPLQTEHVRDFMRQLVDAVEYLHSKGLYHRDIKPENIFLTQAGSMKLGDFGLATTEEWSTEAAVGSDRYMAPEQHEPSGNGYSPAKADIWAIGICLLNVLFSRNPFATPDTSDPLYADFVRDKQSLFDVFPNMSQDTFEVLMHCLAIDPSKRSLENVKAALDRVITFTTDDESLDEFCTEDREVVPASANREPLRTPSISTPQVDHGGSFPWAKALQMVPQQPARQLSAIPDTESYSEDLFPSYKQLGSDWCIVRPVDSSFTSMGDSGLGLSLKSANVTQPESAKKPGSEPVPICGSLPISVSRPSMASVFGKKRDLVSKSWSEMWDEEVEEQSESERENLAESLSEKSNEETRQGRPISSAKDADSGLSTPRAGLVELKNPSMVNNSRNRSPDTALAGDKRVSEHTGFMFENHQPITPRYSPPSKRTVLDKWAALGDRRRGVGSTSDKPKWTTTPTSARKRSRSRAGSWRRTIKGTGVAVGMGVGLAMGASGVGHHGYGSNVWERRDNWSLSKDWRQPLQPAVTNFSVGFGPGDNGGAGVEDDIGDLEWVGGWHDLHL